MAGDKEIKITKQSFETAVSHITTHKDIVISSKDEIVATNSELKGDWLGDGGNAFMLSAKVIEEELKERIADLEGCINDLQVAESTMSNLDIFIGKAINDAMEGTAEVAGKTMGLSGKNQTVAEPAQTFGIADDNSDNTMTIKLS